VRTFYRRAASFQIAPPPAVKALTGRLRDVVGGPARLRVIVLFACVLGLNTADLASLGAVASRLKPALGLDNAELGILAAAPSLVAVVATLPMGVLADRARRVSWLALAVAVWAMGMLLAGACGSFDELLIVRLFLGAAAAASGPLVASLVGDFFWPGERGRIYGYILAGELAGAGFGLLVSGSMAGVSWRAALWVLALPSVAVAAAIWRMLPEPDRGGAGRLPEGARELASTAHAAPGGSPEAPGETQPAKRRDAMLRRVVERSDTSARRELVLESDPREMSMHRAVRYVLSVPTNVLLILASALGYFFQAGVNTFGVVFVISSYRVSQPVATWLLAAVAIGALAGTVLGGRLADVLLGRGRPAARMLVGGVAFIVSSVLFVPGILSGNLAVAMPAYILAAAALGAPNAPVDAARLDIIPAALWGRAEAIRTLPRALAVAAAPLLFGFASDQLASGPRAASKGLDYQASGPGLKYTFLIMLIPMAIGGVILLRASHGYTRDVATAIASDECIKRRHRQ
jgi:MFS family permease